MSSADTPDMEVSKISGRKHVTPGERHALMGRRNQALYESSRKNVTTSTDEDQNMEDVNADEYPTHPDIISNGNDLTFIVLLL